MCEPSSIDNVVQSGSNQHAIISGACVVDLTPLRAVPHRRALHAPNHRQVQPPTAALPSSCDANFEPHLLWWMGCRGRGRGRCCGGCCCVCVCVCCSCCCCCCGCCCRHSTVRHKCRMAWMRVRGDGARQLYNHVQTLRASCKWRPMSVPGAPC